MMVPSGFRTHRKSLLSGSLGMFLLVSVSDIPDSIPVLLDPGFVAIF